MLSWLLARRASAAIVLMAVGAVALGAPPTAVAATPKTTPVLEQGAGLASTPSAAVRRVQRILEPTRLRARTARGADGRFGPLTAAAVRRMQTRYGLAADGVVGPKTRRVLRLMAETSRAPGQRRAATRADTATAAPARPAPPQTTAPRPATHPSTPAPSVTREAVNTDTTTRPRSPLSRHCWPRRRSPSRCSARCRPRSAPVLAAIDRDLYLEGHSDHPGIGVFRGFALATAVPPDAADDPRRARYLVDDPRKPAPVWVEGGDVDRSPSQLAAGEPVIGYVTAEPGCERRAGGVHGDRDRLRPGGLAARRHRPRPGHRPDGRPARSHARARADRGRGGARPRRRRRPQPRPLARRPRRAARVVPRRRGACSSRSTSTWTPRRSTATRPRARSSRCPAGRATGAARARRGLARVQTPARAARGDAPTNAPPSSSASARCAPPG